MISDNYNTDAVDALNTIPPDIDRDEWVKVAMSFKAASGDFEAFNDWSSGSSNYIPKDCRAVWKSVDGAGIGAGTLFFIAGQYGYKSTGSTVDMAAVREKNKKAQIIAEKENQDQHKKAAVKAESILDECGYALAEHPYLVSKQIQPRLMPWVDKNNILVIPVIDLQGNVHSLQRINSKGEKRFLSGGAIAGNFYQLWTGTEGIVICEGYATGVTLYSHYTPNRSVVIAFTAGNLKAVAEVFRAAFPDTRITIAGDFDKSGTGQAKAAEAARSVGGNTSIPVFDADEVGSDWNDRFCLDNLEVAA